MWYVFVNVLLYSSVSWQFNLSKPKLLLICGCKYIVRIYYYVYFSQKHCSVERCVQKPIETWWCLITSMLCLYSMFQPLKKPHYIFHVTQISLDLSVQVENVLVRYVMKLLVVKKYILLLIILVFIDTNTHLTHTLSELGMWMKSQHFSCFMLQKTRQMYCKTQNTL